MGATWQTVGITGAMLYAGLYAAKRAAIGPLKWFEPGDFGAWFPLLDTDLIIKLDQFADYLQTRVIISPAPGAIGRIGTGAESSQHFPKPYIYAIDVMSPGASLEDQYQAARAVGFHGIGLYPNWKPYHGVHLDTRTDRDADNPAEWSSVRKAANGRQVYTGVQAALS